MHRPSSAWHPQTSTSSVPVYPHAQRSPTNVVPQYVANPQQMSPPLSPPLSAGYSYGPPPPMPPRSHAHTFSGQTGYAPINFDGPPGAVTPESFYGSLIDASNRPSEVFTRMCDSLYFWADQNCDIPGLRGTGVVEPAKYLWLGVKLGNPAEINQYIEPCLQDLFVSANIPIKYRQTANNTQIVVLDRRAWLHMAVFDVRSDPEDNFKFWNKAISMLHITDPATSLPFPSPIPRSCFPMNPDPRLHLILQNWQTAIVLHIQRQRTNAMVNQMFARPTYTNPMAYLGGGAVAGTLGTTLFNNTSDSPVPTSPNSSSGDSKPDHATILDTVNTVGTLANTLIGVFGGGNTGGGNGGGNGFGFGN